ncbi:MAG: AMP-binding protein [Alphaproteobacteria bacterium]|nr:AMP-binding protein [Alphaproteobacteria bacterium]
MSDGWTIQSLVRDLAGAGERAAIITMSGDQASAISCASLAERITALACGLRVRGIGPGQTVGLIAPNGPDWVVARLALGCTGALVHTLDDLYSDTELRTALEEAKCSTVLTSPGHVDAIRTFDPACRLVALGDAVPGAISWRDLFVDKADALPAFSSDEPAMLVYTSGTTGKPKSFRLTSAQLWANVRALMASQLVKAGDRVLLPLPLHHVYPFTVGIITVLSCGATVVFPEGLGGPQILRTLSVAEVSAIIGVPRLYSALVSGLSAKITSAGGIAGPSLRLLISLSIWCRRRWDLAIGRWLLAPIRKRLGPRLRLLACGGALLPPDVLWFLAGLGFDVRTGYGLAETASIFTGNLPAHTRLGSEGKAFCGEIRIAPVASTEGLNGDGEIQLHGPTVFSGYCNNEQANRESFTPDGWFRTGDVGHLDADGFLYVTGRIKEMIVLGGGKKVLPDDLEKHYASPFIKELAIIEREGALVALVLPDLEAIRASNYSRVEEIIRVALAERAMSLPSHERLAGYRLVREPLPKTRLQKFQRFRLRAIYDAAETRKPSATGAPSEDDKALLHNSAARAIFEILKTRYAGKEVSLDCSPLLDLGIDSLEWVALSLVIEQQAGVHLDESAVGESLTVRDLLRRAAEAPAAASDAGHEAIIERWFKPSGPLHRLLARLLYAINAALMPPLFSLTVKGRENLPAASPFVIAPNHESDIDPLLVAAALHSIELRWGADAGRLFGSRWLHPLMRALHMFPADERRPGETLALALEVLRRGNCLVWFPESWRSPDGELQRFLPGIGQLLAKGRVPVVPTFIEGAFEAMPRTRKFPRFRPVSITFGPPLMPQDLPEGPPQATADRLHDLVAALARTDQG